MRRRARLLISVMALFVAGCGGGGEPSGRSTNTAGATPAPTITTLADGEKAQFEGTADATGKTELEIELDDFYFEPTIITGSAGQKLTIKAHNPGKAPHSLTLGGADIVDLQAGQEGSGEVTFPTSGAVTFVCKYHTAQNMRGELRVK